MRKFEIVDKVVIVTGAASGIGFATGRAFLEAGARVALIDNDAELLEARARTLSFAFPKDRVVHLPCDVTVDEEVERSIDAVMARWSAIHVLINDAAVVTAGRKFTMRSEVMCTRATTWRSVARAEPQSCA